MVIIQKKNKKNPNGGKNQLSGIIFEIGTEKFIIDVLDVKEIIQTGQIRRLPNCPDFVEGICNYRGEIIHVVNLKKRLKLSNAVLYNTKANDLEHKANGIGMKYLIILNYNTSFMGVLVDRINNIIHIDDDELVELGPIFQTSVSMKFIKGVIYVQEKPRLMLKLDKILEEVEKYALQTEMIAN